MAPLRVLIPAAGRSSRSGLPYPKSLHPVGGEPIIVRLCRKLRQFDPVPTLIINPAHEAMFREALTTYGLDAHLIHQTEPRGMGAALLEADRVLPAEADVLVAWSDLPVLSARTLRRLVDCHRVAANHFSLVTALVDSCYTVVERRGGCVQRVIETRALGRGPAGPGERDIGVFVFRKEPVFAHLRRGFAVAPHEGEYGFLPVVETLVAAGLRVEGYPIALPCDLLGFNTPEELQRIEAAWAAGARDEDAA